MRAKLILAIVTGLLLCTISTLEVPEFLKLTDDTSNDFSLTTVQNEVPPVTELEAAREDKTPSVIALKLLWRTLARSQSRKFEPSLDDFLHSLCILRT